MTVSNEGSALPGQAASPRSTSGTSRPSDGTTTKLHGRAFYESIGSPKFVLAPMVDQSEFAWRLLSRSFMTPESNKKLVAYTPMLHARMFQEMPKFRDRMFQPLRASLASIPAPPFTPTDVYLDGNPAKDRPLFVQFCANSPDELLEAAKYVAPFCDAVDLNLGCPQGIAKRGNYGAFLQEDQDLIFRLINNLHLNLSVPVTAKIRILETREKTLAYAKNVLSAGASILTVHGRQREQKGHKTGLADWSVIRYLRENLPAETVMFANGNILKREDIDACLAATGVDGVMSAEGNLYDPAIFAEAPPLGEEGREYWLGKDRKGGYRMDAVLRRYMDIIHKHVLEQPIPDRSPLYIPSDAEVPREKSPEQAEEEDGPPKKKQKRSGKAEKVTNPNLTAMQAHLFHLLRALVGKHHHIRDALAKCRAGDITAFEHVLHLVELACAKGIKEYAETDGKSWEEEVARDEVERKRKDDEARRLRDEKILKDGVNVEGEGEGEVDESSVETVRQVRRPWWVVQPYVRPLPKEAMIKGSWSLSRKEKKALGIESVEKKSVNGNGNSSQVNREEDSGNAHVTIEKTEEGKREAQKDDGVICS